MKNKYTTSLILFLVLISSLLYWSNTNVDTEAIQPVTTTLQEDSSSTTSTTTSTTTTLQEDSLSTTSTTTSTTTTLQEDSSTTTLIVQVNNVAVSEDSESVQIINNEEEEVVVYDGPFTSFAGFQGANQSSLDNLVIELPEALRKILEKEVLVINGCHQYALLLVGRCPYGVWDSSGIDPEGEKGAEWALSIWISDRAFATGDVRDVLIHEASHALSYLTKTCISSENTNFRKDAWDYFDGEEQFADALVLYFEGEYNHYRTKGPLTDQETEYLNNYISTCT